MRGALVLGLALLLSPSVGLADYVGNLNPKGDNYLTLRQYANAKSQSLSRMGPNTIVEVLERDGDWVYIQTADGRIGWAFRKYILPGLPGGTKAKAAPAPVVTAPPPTPIIIDPYDWVEGHVMRYHGPLVYYP
jgi:hypothetical protein